MALRERASGGSPPRGSFALGLGMVSAAIGAMGHLVMAAVGIGYGMEPSAYVGPGIAAVLILAVVIALFVIRARSGALSLGPSIAAAAVGSGLALYGAILTAMDAGDALFLYIWPVVTGVCLIALALEERKAD
jgi:hypothetical protein